MKGAMSLPGCCGDQPVRMYAGALIAELGNGASAAIGIKGAMSVDGSWTNGGVRRYAACGFAAINGGALAMPVRNCATSYSIICVGYVVAGVRASGVGGTTNTGGIASGAMTENACGTGGAGARMYGAIGCVASPHTTSTVSSS